MYYYYSNYYYYSYYCFKKVTRGTRKRKFTRKWLLQWYMWVCFKRRSIPPGHSCHPHRPTSFSWRDTRRQSSVHCSSTGQQRDSALADKLSLAELHQTTAKQKSHKTN